MTISKSNVFSFVTGKEVELSPDEHLYLYYLTRSVANHIKNGFIGIMVSPNGIDKDELIRTVRDDLLEFPYRNSWYDSVISMHIEPKKLIFI